VIEELGRTKTILLSTHVLSEVQAVCRRVVILSRGRVVADGSPLDLAASEREALRVTVRGREARPEAVQAELEGVPGVVAVRPQGTDDEGRIGVELEVSDRNETAARVAGLVHARGWTLIELRHELPTLEHVFLRRTEATAGAVPPRAGEEAPA